MIRAAICDDNKFDLAHLRSLLENCGIPLEIAEYADAENLLWDIETEKAAFDIYLLDIYLSGASGMEAARRLRAMDEHSVLIFVTASRDFYQEAFDVYALYYLVKPATQETLNALMERVAARMEHQRQAVLPISYRGRTCILRHDEIEYISSSNHTLCFHLHGGEERICYGKLDEVVAQLSSGSFTRCHQSYIVNLQYVRERVADGFRMGNAVIPISRSYSEEAQAALNQYLFGAFEHT